MKYQNYRSGFREKDIKQPSVSNCSKFFLLFNFFFFFWEERVDSTDLAADFNIVLALAVMEWGMTTLENAFEN